MSSKSVYKYLNLPRPTTKGILYSSSQRNDILQETDTWPLKEECMIKLNRNNARIFRWVFNMGLEHRTSTV